VWADVAMDFIVGFPRINDKSVILTVVDRFSNATHLLPLGHPYVATTVPRAFFNNVVKLHSVPSSIMSDRNPVLTPASSYRCRRLSIHSLTGNQSR
jgi:hypothetical protein